MTKKNYTNSVILLLVSQLFVLLTCAYASDNKQLKQEQKPQSTVSSSNMADKKIVIIGASYAKSWSINKISGHTVINKGVGGNETREMLARFQTDVLDQKPSAVLIWGFINDIFRSSPEKLEKKIEKTKKNLMQMIEKAKSQDINILLATEVTITSRQNWKEKIMGFLGSLLGKKSYVDYINKHVMQTNNWLRDLAVKQNIQLLEFEKLLADKDGRRKNEFTIEDGSHFSPQAYVALTTYVESVDINI